MSVIAEIFGLSLSEADVVAARDRALQANSIVYNTYRGQYALSSEKRKATWDRIQAGEDLESRAQESWLAEVEHLVPEQSSEALWACLLAYAGKAFLSHGMDAVKLLDPCAQDFDDLTSDDGPEALLRAAISESSLSESIFPEISQAIAVFFDGRNADRVTYVAELVDSAFNFLALGFDDETRESLVANVPALDIFVDTNVILSIIGAHANPQDMISGDLFNLLQSSDLPFNVFYHERTLRELENTLSGAGDRLRRLHYTPSLSRARLSFPRQMSSIEMRYHQLNSEVGVSVDIFLGRYSNIPLLLADHGFKIFRESGASQEEDRRRAELVEEYKAYIAENNPNKAKTYEAVNHDVAIWLAAANRQKPRGKGPLFSGALIVSADNTFRKFDREVLSPCHGSGTWIVTRPDTLSRALRLFLESNRQSDAAFTQIFATPEFRGIGQGSQEAVSRVAAYLATYANLPEETATKILANDLLMSRMREIDRRDGVALARLVQEEIVRENEALLQEWEATRSKARLKLSSISGELSARGESDLVDRFNELLDIFSKRNSVNIERVVMTDSGGYYENTQSQVGSQGPNATAHNFTQQADQRQVATDLPTLALELDQLKQQLLQQATSSGDYQAVAEIQAAREAADEGDESGTTRHLVQAGRRAFDAAVQIGASVAAAALGQALGIG